MMDEAEEDDYGRRKESKRRRRRTISEYLLSTYLPLHKVR
jgi:hypothetical protein